MVGGGREEIIGVMEDERVKAWTSQSFIPPVTESRAVWGE